MNFHANFYPTAATTNATSDPLIRGGSNWGYQATITGTGAISATLTVQGSNDGTNWTTIGSAMSLSGTTTDTKTATSTVPWRMHRTVIASITGTGAAVTCNGEGA